MSEKLLLEAEATGFQDPDKGGWEPVGPSGRKKYGCRARVEATGCILITARRTKNYFRLRITATSTASREIQLGLKVLF